MLGSILKFTLSFSALILFIALVWQSPVADAVPIQVGDENHNKFNDGGSRMTANTIHKGNLKNPRTAKRMKNILENRLKRFRMLDQDEFQEMLKSFGQQSANHQAKVSSVMDSIGGMQLANYWSRK